MKPAVFIEQVEGNDSKKLADGRFGATWDIYGKCWNIGPGLTHGITKDTVMTKEQIDAATDAELSATEAAVDKLVKVPVGENQRTVLISFAYNIGISGLAHSSVLTVLNVGHYDQVPAHLALYNKSRGVFVQGLVNRRNQEIALWKHPDDHPAPTVQSVSVPKADPHPAVTQEAFMAATPVPTSIASNPVVNAAVQTATLPLTGIFTSITGMFSSVGVAGALGVLSTFAPNLTITILAYAGAAAALVSAGAHVYSIFTGVSATNNATITLAENFLNTIEQGLGGKPFSFDNNPTPTSAA